MLQHDLSILMATELIKTLGAAVPATTTEKIKYIRAIQDLTVILAGQQTPEAPPVPRVVVPNLRVPNAPPPRVATTSNNITAPNIIRNMPLMHQRQTHNNNPFNILTDNDDDDDIVMVSNCSPHTPLPSVPTSELPIHSPTNLPRRQLAIQPTSLPTTNQPSSLPTSPPSRVLAGPTHIQATTPTAPHTRIHDLRPMPVG